MKIRTAVIDDLSAVDDIYNEAIIEGYKTAHTDPMSVNARKEWFGKFNDRYPLYVYEEEGEVLGWLSVSSYRPGQKCVVTDSRS